MGRWTILNFTKYKGHTLPHVVLHDPDWFFWAWDQRVFVDRGPLTQEAREVATKAKRIRIPRNRDGRLVVEYRVDRTTGRFGTFEVVDASEDNQSSAPRTGWIDLSVIRLFSQYDKRGGRLFVRQISSQVFGSSKTRLTTARCERFFEDDGNFLLPERD